jgi:hypothetical protein
MWQCAMMYLTLLFNSDNVSEFYLSGLLFAHAQGLKKIFVGASHCQPAKEWV